MTAPAGVTDPNLANNSATDTDNIGTATVKLGDLHLCGVTSLGRLDGESVHEFLVNAENRFGGVAATVPTLTDLDTVAAELNASFDSGTPSDFALQHLSLSRACQTEPWQTNEFSTYTQNEWPTQPAPLTLLYNDFANVYNLSDGDLVVGDSPGGTLLLFTTPDAVVEYLPASGPVAALDQDVTDPTSTSSGAFGGDLTALQLNVDFDAVGYRFFPRTCSPAGTAACPFAPGDVVTYAPSQWSGDPTATHLLLAEFATVYNPSNGDVVIGDFSSGLFMLFTTPDAVMSYLPALGPPAALSLTVTDPPSTSSGSFGGGVTALELNVDFSDAGYLTGASGARFGDLTFCNLPTTDSYPTSSAALAALNGTTVRQFLALVSDALSGEPSAYTPAQLDPLLQSLNASFEQGFITVMSPYLYNGPCP